MTTTKEQPTRDNPSTRKQRHIIRRIVIRCTLILDTPTCLGSGDAESPTDLALLKDSISDHALLTGSSIGGALRNYVREYGGYDAVDESRLFGCQRSDDDGAQSPLIIYDALSSDHLKAELRDGVKISTVTGTAEKGAKYDLELLEAGTAFNLCFELAIDRQDSNENLLIKELAIALSGLEQGEISLGMKKRRGFGRCHVEEWQVWNFNLEDASDRTAWLLFDRECTNKQPVITNKIADALGVVLDEKEDKRDRFTINATFTLASPLLIRSGQAETGRAPDVVHLKSYRIINQQIKCLFDLAIQILGELPSQIDLWSSKNWELFFFAHNLLKAKVLTSVLSGTSLAGVLRHRAERIVKTLQCSFGHNPECDKEPEIVQCIFGDVNQKRSQASRLIVHESTINHTTDLVQTRIAIDRFTGGTYHGALFQEQPIFGKGDENLKLEIELRNPDQHEIGLLLLLLKDLWTEDLPVGGSSSVGRGRLQGKVATLVCSKEGKSWIISQPNLKENYLEITGSDRQDLENYVNKLVEYAQQETTKNDQT